jgi:hypothetical protein
MITYPGLEDPPHQATTKKTKATVNKRKERQNTVDDGLFISVNITLGQYIYPVFGQYFSLTLSVRQIYFGHTVPQPR